MLTTAPPPKEQVQVWYRKCERVSHCDVSQGPTAGSRTYRRLTPGLISDRARRPSRIAGHDRNAGEVALPFTFRPAPQRRH